VAYAIATERQRSGQPWFEASQGRKLVRPYLKNKASYGGMCLISQPYRRHRQEDCGLRTAQAKTKTLYEK
jgi:hypothetical protein